MSSVFEQTRIVPSHVLHVKSSYSCVVTYVSSLMDLYLSWLVLFSGCLRKLYLILLESWMLTCVILTEETYLTEPETEDLKDGVMAVKRMKNRNP